MGSEVVIFYQHYEDEEDSTLKYPTILSDNKMAASKGAGMLRKCFAKLCKSRHLELFQGSYTGKLSRDLSSIAPEAEPAPPLSIFRTTESDPAKHNQMHLGMYYTVPPEEFAVVFPQIRPNLYAQQVETFNEACIMIREPALEIIGYLSSANYSLPATRYLIYGKKGSGKSITLNHVVHYCATQGWLTVHVPDAHLWVKNCRDMLPSTYRQGRYDQPTQAVNWLRKFRISNEKFLKEMKTQKAYTWTKSEFTEEGTFLLDVLEKGIARPRVASDIVGMLFKELKQYSLAKSVRMLVAVDGANSLWGRSVLKKEDKSLIMTEELTLIWNLRKLIRSDWSNGAIVLESSQTGSVFRRALEYLPTPLLGQEGFDAVDPFVPINVRNYSEKEFESCYMYYLERKWLQHEHVKTEAGKQELKFLCNKNPATMEKLSAFL
uniref:small ribosomal subunit protein mS29 isoform X2 n=1 Tax=Myxine glutinosa TaxID=7769 RepID=UPI00358F19AA